MTPVPQYFVITQKPSSWSSLFECNIHKASALALPTTCKTIFIYLPVHTNCLPFFSYALNYLTQVVCALKESPRCSLLVFRCTPALHACFSAAFPHGVLLWMQKALRDCGGEGLGASETCVGGRASERASHHRLMLRSGFSGPQSPDPRARL